MFCISSTLKVSHCDKSGKDISDSHELNKLPNILTFEVFHFDISGMDIKEL